MQNCTISQWQSMGYLISTVFATSILFVPGIVATGAGPNGWLSTFIALAFGVLVVWLAFSLGARYPDKTVIEYSVDILGFPLGKLVGFLYVYYFLYLAYLVLREFVELISSAYMNQTPVLVIALLLALLSCLALYLGLEVIVRANGIILFFNVLTIFLIFLVFIWEVNWSMLKPDFSKGIGPIIYGSLSPAGWLGETAIILMLIPFIKNKIGIKSTSLLAVFLIFIMLQAVIILVVGILGSTQTSRQIFPLFYLLANPPESIQGFIFQPSGFFMPVWVAGMFMKLTTFFFAGVYGLAQWFGLRNYRPLILPAGSFVLVLSIASWQNIIDLLEFTTYVDTPFISVINLGLTSIVYVASLIRHSNKSTKVGET